VLFDLKGRRRRVVQATYLMLAILMGGGLVFFGIGGDVSGGLFDAFSDRSSSGNDIVQERIEENEDKVEADPQNAAALKELARDWYQLATQEADAQVSGGGGTSRCCEPCLVDTDCTSLCPYCRSGLCYPCPPGQPCVCGIIP